LFVVPPVLKLLPVQVWAFELVHVSVDDPPDAMNVKFAEMSATTGGPTTTVRFETSVAPPAPTQVSA
jgi:hypothetical protein